MGYLNVSYNNRKPESKFRTRSKPDMGNKDTQDTNAKMSVSLVISKLKLIHLSTCDNVVEAIFTNDKLNRH